MLTDEILASTILSGTMFLNLKENSIIKDQLIGM
jgi:hypothetical protein